MTETAMAMSAMANEASKLKHTWERKRWKRLTEMTTSKFPTKAHSTNNAISNSPSERAINFKDTVLARCGAKVVALRNASPSKGIVILCDKWALSTVFNKPLSMNKFGDMRFGIRVRSLIRQDASTFICSSLEPKFATRVTY